MLEIIPSSRDFPQTWHDCLHNSWEQAAMCPEVEKLTQLKTSLLPFNSTFIKNSHLRIYIRPSISFMYRQALSHFIFIYEK